MKSLGNLLVKSCWRLLVFSIAKLTQDNSDGAGWGADGGSSGAAEAVSSSFGFVEVVWSSIIMMRGSQVDSGSFLMGMEKPDGAGSKRE